jgi:hypothetical protein
MMVKFFRSGHAFSKYAMEEKQTLSHLITSDVKPGGSPWYHSDAGEHSPIFMLVNVLGSHDADSPESFRWGE